uniref:Uncharacterized protein n=1 Tax=Glossina austeni TaxID=7395 RepID=A0A1A9VCP3_GLOAU
MLKSTYDMLSPPPPTQLIPVRRGRDLRRLRRRRSAEAERYVYNNRSKGILCQIYKRHAPSTPLPPPPPPRPPPRPPPPPPSPPPPPTPRNILSFVKTFTLPRVGENPSGLSQKFPPSLV